MTDEQTQNPEAEAEAQRAEAERAAFDEAVRLEVERRERERAQADRPAAANPDAPWEIARKHVEPKHEADIDPRSGRVNDVPVPYTGPGAVTHNEPILGSGSAGEPVRRLAGLLAAAGYSTNTVIRGENPANVLDDSVMADVKRFCSDHNVSNDVAEFQGRQVPPGDLVGEHVGPYVWQALYDLAEERAA